MNLKAALDDMKASIEGLDFKPKVEFFDQQKGAPNLVTLVPGPVEEEYRFGEVKRFYSITMRLYQSADNVKPATVHERCTKINQALTIDRKRGGNATTTIVGDWSEQEINGKALAIMVSEPQIQLIETC